MTLIGKTRLAFMANAHALLDKVIDRNSIPVMEQFCRDLENDVKQMEHTLASARADVTGAERRIEALVSANKKYDEQITQLLSDEDPKNDHFALSLQAKFTGNEQSLVTERETLQQNQETMRAYEEILSQMQARFATESQQLVTLRSLQARAATKEHAAETLERVTATSSAVDPQTVGAMSEKIHRRDDAASERLKMAMSKIGSDAEQNAQMSSVQAALAQRKKDIAAKKAGATVHA